MDDKHRNRLKVKATENFSSGKKRKKNIQGQNLIQNIKPNFTYLHSGIMRALSEALSFSYKWVKSHYLTL